MTDKKDAPSAARISKAPPPLKPVGGSRYIAPAMPKVPPPNWGKWAYMRDVEIWEAVALSVDLEPDELPVYLRAYEMFGDDPFRICPPPFLERLLVVNSNCGISLGFKSAHQLKARCLVDLPEFAAWAVKLNIPNLPSELVAMAVAPKATELEDWLRDPIPYAQACETLGATSAELALWICFGDLHAWRTTKHRFHDSDLENPATAGDAIQRLMTLKLLLSKSEVEAFNLDWVERYVSFETAAGLIKAAAKDATHEAEMLEEWRRLHRILSDPKRGAVNLPQIAAFVPGNAYATRIEDGLVMESQIKIFLEGRCGEAAPVVAVSDATPDPVRRLAKLRELGGEAKYSRGNWTFKGISALVRSEEGRKRSTEKTIREDLKEAAQDELDARRNGLTNGLGQR